MTFSMKYNVNINVRNCFRNVDKIIWKPEKADSFNEFLNSKKFMFDDLSNKLLSGEYDINNYVNCFSNIIYDISFQCFGKTLSSKPRIVRKNHHGLTTIAVRRNGIS